jgi:pyruvate dehydrogenase (quinone)
MDARKEGAPITAIAGDVESSIIDTSSLEELNPYKFFEAASFYAARLVNPHQARAVINTAVLTAVLEQGPTVPSIPGDVASAHVEVHSTDFKIAARPLLRPSDADLNTLVQMIDRANTVAIFGGEGCKDGRDEVVELARRLKAPVGYSFRGKQWLEHDNPNAVGMTGLLGYGGAYNAIHEAELLLLLGTDFPFSEFLPGAGVLKVQIDKNPKHIGRRTPVDLGLVGDVKTTVTALLQAVGEKPND